MPHRGSAFLALLAMQGRVRHFVERALHPFSETPNPCEAYGMHALQSNASPSPFRRTGLHCFAMHAHAQGRSVGRVRRSVHPYGMQGRVRRSVGRVGLTRPHRPVSLGACESCREGAPQGLHWKARGYYRAPMRLPPKAVQVHMKSGALDGVELFQNCCN